MSVLTFPYVRNPRVWHVPHSHLNPSLQLPSQSLNPNLKPPSAGTTSSPTLQPPAAGITPQTPMCCLCPAREPAPVLLQFSSSYQQPSPYPAPAANPLCCPNPAPVLLSSALACAAKPLFYHSLVQPLCQPTYAVQPSLNPTAFRMIP
ncbi:hypothetical protein Acr_05g0013940 [Actinidia rufa]|uniref:Uncharacterized protein n=1 Tax=Actinidia rufa TaxID=165716 RepID=A0A7J0EMN6_9ERIC|nr:hypothetical protein Acr_05g0013940 [Actinidia rufa]